MTQSSTFTQVDFSLGQITKTALRRIGGNDAIGKACRTARNFQPLVSGGAESRFGRRALYLSGARNEEVRMPPGILFKLEWLSTQLKIRNATTGAVLATFSSLPWSTATDIRKIRWALHTNEFVVTYPGMVPKVVTYNPTTTAWSIADHAFLTGLSGKLRQVYYRFAETAGITMQPSARTGSVTVTFSAAVLVPAHVGVRFRYAEEEMTLTGYTSSTVGTATVNTKLPPSGKVTLTTPDGFAVDDNIQGDTSGTLARITRIVGSDAYFVLLNNYNGFSSGETLISPRSKSVFTAPNYALSPEASLNWTEALISPARGYPASCAVDARRLIFTQFPSVPNGVLWGEIGEVYGFDTGKAAATDAFFEKVPGQAVVYDVIGGEDEFVICDSGVYYVPISVDNPLKPGSVEFRSLGPEGGANVAPTATTEGVLYVNAGRTRIMAIIGTGNQTRSYIVRDITMFHSDLFNSPVCMAVSSGEGVDPARYAYVVNGDGTAVIARYDTSEDVVGWFPWNGDGVVQWVSARGSTPLFTSTYGGVTVAEEQVQYGLLDGEVPAVSPPTPLAPGVGQGPFWMYPGQTIFLRRNRRPIGPRLITGTGDITWLDSDEDRALTNISGGFDFDCELDQFIPHVSMSENRHQRMRKRKILRTAVVVQMSTGFIYGNRRIGMDTVRSDRTVDPVPVDATYTFRPAGRSHDPHVPLQKDTPGTLRVIEITTEVTV